VLSAALVVVAGLLWLGLLFGTALWGERRPQLFGARWGAVYALSLAVYCTSWTFYGTVTQAARSGWPLPPTFVGTILLYALGLGLLLRVVRAAREHNSSSIADLIATRLGKSSWLAAAVTAVALLGMIPYLALQLKAVAMSFALLTRGGETSAAPWEDSALYVALAMALFAMLFGTRSAAAAEHNRGLVLAMAVESLLKLGAMLALGAFVLLGPYADAPPLQPRADGADGFPALVVLGVLAMFTLPHQFHVGVVECRDERHLRTARWLFPLYMVLIALPILPLARAGEAHLAPLGVPSDLYVLALPLAQGQHGLALLAFLGGLSAATGMVILATLSLSLMIGNHWLAPLRVRGAWAQPGGPSRRGEVLLQRRVGILAVVLLAWGYSRAIAGSDALADIGAVSFSALATLAPALGFALWRPQTPPRAVLAGLGVAVGVWIWALLLPSLAPLLWQRTDWIASGPWGWSWLAPDALLGLSGWSRLLRALVLSLVAGTGVTWLLALRRGHAPAPGARAEFEVAALRDLAARFLPEARVEQLFVPGVPADALESQIERELASVLGTASARLLLETARGTPGSGLQTVATLVGEASQALRFNQRLLEAALEHMSQGVSVVDRELRLVAWNRRYAELFGFPDSLLEVGRPVEALARWAIARGFTGDAVALDRAVARRVAHMRAGTPHLSERRFPDGTVVEIRGNPMPGGGFVATFTDVTAFRHAEQELTRANETLEQRVEDRTSALAQASSLAERANRAKTRFLAAVSHDLAQPLNAARLFTHALGQQLERSPQSDAVAQIDGALDSAEGLLAGLLDISRLDAGGMSAQVRSFRLDELLQHLAAEFRVLAGDKGLELRCVPTRAWVRSDPQLLRRVLQNFLSNAVRYTAQGRVLIGCRRQRDALRIEVWDTGPGIADSDRGAIFEEFRRLDRGGQGLGLGLAIAERIARLLGHPLTLRSRLGRGTVFAVEVERGAPVAIAERTDAEHVPEAPRSRVLVVDNDSTVLQAMRTLLRTWRCEVFAARDAGEAAAAFAASAPQLLLLDFHLDDGITGLALRDRLGAAARAIPCVIITADHDPATRAAVEAAGCLLLHKPLKPLALKSVMARVMAASAAGTQAPGASITK
jgi:signal transduction histidine kinase/ActR/RegA family two-component response regulator